MPTNVVIRDQKFYSEFKNDEGFVSNLADFTPNLTGSVMENVKMTTLIDINWSAASSASDSWTVDTLNLVISRTSGDFRADGFAQNDVCEWLQNGVITANITISGLSNDGLQIFYTLNSGSITDSNNASLAGVTDLTSLEWNFGLIGNGETFNIRSKVSGNDQGYYANNVGIDGGGGRSTSFVTMLRLAQYEDWRTGSMRVRYVSNPAFDIQRFEVEHEFTIVPWYLDGELSNLQNSIIPTLFAGQNTLKYVFEPKFQTTGSNPNTIKTDIIDNNLGAVAWYGENFNGFNNNYQINSITYEEQATTNSADGLLIGSKTRVTIDVEKLTGSFSVGERAGVYISLLPEQTDYENTTTTNLKDNFLYDSAINNESLAPTIGAQGLITNFNISSPVGSNMILEFDVEYSTAQKVFLSQRFQNDPTYFLIGVQLGDVTVSSGNSDKIMVLADVELYDESPDIPGLIDFKKFDIYPHDKQIGVDTGFTNYIGWNEDGIVVDFRFGLNVNQLAVINTLSFKLQAYNSVTQETFDLDSFDFPDIGTATVSNGIQQLNANTTRGYNLATGDQFNDVFLETDNLVGNDQFYNGRLGQKISWQDWIENLSVDNSFFDASKPNDNKNLRSSNYSDINNWTIRVSAFANVDGVSTLGVSGNTDYLFLSPALTIYDYDLDGNVTPAWSATIETFHPTTLVNLQGKVLSGLNTIMRTTWVNVSPPITSVADMWAIHRIEETNQNGYAIDELSTINAFPTPNRVIPSVGETQLTIDPVSGNVVTECLVDGSQIALGVDYNLSARLNELTAIPVDAKVTEAGIAKETEGGQIKIIE